MSQKWNRLALLIAGGDSEQSKYVFMCVHSIQMHCRLHTYDIDCATVIIPRHSFDNQILNPFLESHILALAPTTIAFIPFSFFFRLWHLLITTQSTATIHYQQKNIFNHIVLFRCRISYIEVQRTDCCAW